MATFELFVGKLINWNWIGGWASASTYFAFRGGKFKIHNFYNPKYENTSNSRPYSSLGTGMVWDLMHITSRMILRIQLKLNTALLSTVRPSVCPSVTGVTFYISHIYKGINAMLIIRRSIILYILNQNHPGFLSSKDQTRQDHVLCPDQPDHWLWLWIIKNINAESAVFTLSCLSHGFQHNYF